MPTCIEITSTTHFSDDSKVMIREMGNVELFELCETNPEVLCSHLYWSQGDLLHLWTSLGWKRIQPIFFNQWRLDALSIPHYVIKKVRPHGARHCKTEAQKEYFIVFNAWKRCITKNDEGIYDRFLRDPVYRDSQHKIGWTEEKCIEMDKLAQEDHSYRLSREEYLRYQEHWYLTLNKSGKNAPMRLRSDFRAEVTIMNRLHRESGEERAEPTSPQQFRRWHPSSSSGSWWNWDTFKSWRSWRVQFICCFFFFLRNNVCCSRFRWQLITICCNRRGV